MPSIKDLRNSYLIVSVFYIKHEMGSRAEKRVWG